MSFFARFSNNNNNNHNKEPKQSKQQRRERRSGPPPSIKPRDSSLYGNNFAAAASVSCLPLYGATARNQSSFALASPRPHTDYDILARRNFSLVDISRAPEHPPSNYQSFAVEDRDDVFHPRFAIPSEDFALAPRATLSRRSALKTKTWASRSVVGLVRRRMSGKQDDAFTGDQWPIDSQYPGEQDDMVPPPVPSKSALRAPAANYAPAVYQLPVDPPKDATPSLSSASSDDGDMPTSPDLRTPASSDHSWGRKKRQESRDPHKVRDGTPRKGSTSGVYTPTTFPGAHGPRPSHFPSHVYTPNQYPGPAGPSRSSSMSSTSASGSDRSSPRTPHSPVSPKWSTASLSSGFKRLSTTFASLDPRQNSSPRESYFPPISTPSYPTHSRTTSWSGASALGFEAPPSPPANRARYSVTEIKRKPVPKLDEVQVEIEKLDLERDESRTPTQV